MDNIHLSAHLDLKAEQDALSPRPPTHILDAEAIRKIDGGYLGCRRKKGNLGLIASNPLCPNCFVRKSVTGACNCDE